MIYQDWDLELEGPNIRITPMYEEDGEAYGRLLFGNAYNSFAQQLGEDRLPTGLKDILAHTSPDETHAIRLKEDDRLIGWITLQKNKNNDPDIGISLSEEQQNKGYGPEAVMLLCNRLHEEYGLKQIYVRISKKNMQSRNAFAKVGAVPDEEILNEQFARLLEENPKHQISEGFIPITCCYHIPLPIREITSGNHPDDEIIQKAEEAYEEEQTQYIREFRLISLESIENKCSADGKEIPSELRRYIDECKKELQNPN